jgi:hypothetical protein
MAAQRKYPEELRGRAVKMVSEIRERDGKGHGAPGFSSLAPSQRRREPSRHWFRPPLIAASITAHWAELVTRPMAQLARIG